jgi:hypothetical protein
MGAPYPTRIESFRCTDEPAESAAQVAANYDPTTGAPVYCVRQKLFGGLLVPFALLGILTAFCALALGMAWLVMRVFDRP